MRIVVQSLAVGVAVLMLASAPADAAKRRAKRVVQPAPVDTNEASARLMRESLPLFLPSAAQVVYFSTQSSADQTTTKPKKRKASH